MTRAPARSIVAPRNPTRGMRAVGGVRGGPARAIALAVTLATAVAMGVPATAAAADVSFDPPTSQAAVLKPLEFEETFHASEEPDYVELLVVAPGQQGTYVQRATVSSTASGAYRAAVTSEDHQVPNTTYQYRFRLHFADGSVTLGPQAKAKVVDDRFTWHTMAGNVVRLHWYSGGDAFAREALQIGEAAIAKASALFGVTRVDPVDFFVYADSDAFLQALGPGTRENTGGQYRPAIRTLFADIAPDQIGSGWVQSVIPHELTHLVFDTATKNPYHDPPLWLDEGLAVYLSDGPDPSAPDLQAGIRSGRILPLAGLTGSFPRNAEDDVLSYAEAVSAVAFLVHGHGQASILRLVRAYAKGATDDEAFQAAAGQTMAQFGATWLASIGVSAPPTYGPRPAPGGPVPDAWRTSPSPEPAVTSPAGSAAVVGAAGRGGVDGGGPSSPIPSSREDLPPVALPFLVAAVAVVAVVAGLVAASRRRQRGGTR